jgi:hypothetical protein
VKRASHCRAEQIPGNRICEEFCIMHSALLQLNISYMDQFVIVVLEENVRGRFVAIVRVWPNDLPFAISLWLAFFYRSGQFRNQNGLCAVQPRLDFVCLNI